MGALAKILAALKTMSPTTAGTTSEKAWNIAYLVVAAAAAIVVGACQLGVPVPGVDCAVIQASQPADPQ